MRTVYASSGESALLELTITDTSGADLSTLTFEYGWGSLTGVPTVWAAPISKNTATLGSAVLTILADNAVPVGTYFLWAKVTDTNGHSDFVRVSNEEVAVV